MIDTDEVKNNMYKIIAKGDPCESCLVGIICDKTCSDKTAYTYASTLEKVRVAFMQDNGSEIFNEESRRRRAMQQIHEIVDEEHKKEQSRKRVRDVPF